MLISNNLPALMSITSDLCELSMLNVTVEAPSESMRMPLSIALSWIMCLLRSSERGQKKSDQPGR
jgi:hypothetical protein